MKTKILLFIILLSLILSLGSAKMLFRNQNSISMHVDPTPDDDYEGHIGWIH